MVGCSDKGVYIGELKEVTCYIWYKCKEPHGQGKQTWKNGKKYVGKFKDGLFHGQGTLTKLLGTSAWYAPGASVSYLVDSILNDRRLLIPCSVLLEGEYKQKDICIGVPCIIGKNGVESILDLELNSDEIKKFENSSASVRSMNEDLKDI